MPLAFIRPPWYNVRSYKTWRLTMVHHNAALVFYCYYYFFTDKK